MNQNAALAIFGFVVLLLAISIHGFRPLMAASPLNVPLLARKSSDED
jgi:hypothetical protein